MEIQNDSDAGRIYTIQDGLTSELDYQMDGDTMVIMHTGVPAQLEGRGIASALTKAALEYARENSFKVVSFCWFVSGYINRHSEYQDLL